MTYYAGNTYFAMDGSYGDATDMIILDTALWTEEDWVEIDEAQDNERSNIAQAINIKHKKEQA